MSSSIFSKSINGTVTRDTIEYAPTGAQSYTINGTQNVVRFEIPSESQSLDCENCYLRADLEFTTADDGNTATLVKYPGAAMQKVLRLLTKGGQVIGVQENNHAGNARLYKDFHNSSDYEDSYGRWTELPKGLNPASGAAFAANTSYVVEITHKFDVSTFLGLKNMYYPMHAHNGFILEIELPLQIKEMLTYTTVASSFKISNLRFGCELVRLQPQVEQMILNLVKSGQLKVDYVSAYTDIRNIPSATAQMNVDISSISGRVKSIISEVINIGSATTVDFYERRVNDALAAGGGFIKSYQYRLNTRYLNKTPVQMEYNAAVGTTVRKGRQVVELMKALDQYHSDALMNRSGNSNRVSVDQLALMGVKVDKSQRDTDKDISSDLDKDNNTVHFELIFGTSIDPSSTTVYELHSHFLLDKSYVIMEGGQINNLS